MGAVSLKLPDELLEASGRCADALRIPRAEYIRRAIERMNRETQERLRAKRSHRTRSRCLRGARFGWPRASIDVDRPTDHQPRGQADTCRFRLSSRLRDLTSGSAPSPDRARCEQSAGDAATEESMKVNASMKSRRAPRSHSFPSSNKIPMLKRGRDLARWLRGSTPLSRCPPDGRGTNSWAAEPGKTRPGTPHALLLVQSRLSSSSPAWTSSIHRR